MIAELFDPLEVECLVKTAADLWEDGGQADLSGRQREVLERARTAVLAEHAGRPLPSQAAAALVERTPGRVCVLRRWDRHEDEVTLWRDEDAAMAALAEYVRGVWDNTACDHDVPDEPPDDDHEAVQLYYGPDGDSRPDEGHCVYDETIGRRRRTRILPPGYRFPDERECAQANRNALFHPKVEDDGVPYLENCGIRVFACLDELDGAFLVFVDPDDAEDRLVRPDGTVPLRIETPGTVLLDSTAPPGTDR
ncbi:hypothetical protein [Streptomyces nanshensis]|uniref:hypothetical protein n=1 Tax=Streptomyces nanshensis TaxID=518642 RepID=UPI00085C454F|nr:hypothetical protein [Streptomyces nanshensis]